MNPLPTGLPAIQNSGLAPQELTRRLALLNLDTILYLLTLRASDGGKYEWSKEMAAEAIEIYRRFLYMKVTADFVVIPTRRVDAIWHLHMADTRKYLLDCNNTFEFFVHHFPYLGMRGEQDRMLLRELYQKSSAHYEATFGEEYSGIVADEAADCA